VANYGDKSQYVSLDSTSRELLRQTQLLLLGFGIKSKLYEGLPAAGEHMLPDGRGGERAYPVKEMLSLRISRASRFRFEREIGFHPASPKAAALHALNQEFGAYRDELLDAVASIEPCGEEEVFDLTERATEHFVANGLVVHNCSEYMFVDDSACNLASLNLMKFLGDSGEFDVASFRHAVDILITAMEIIVPNSSYPTPAIERNSHDYRPLGLGYANLGALLMARGLAYDSDAGRDYAAAITALLSGQGYLTSAKIARGLGPFPNYPPNSSSMLEVMRKHRRALGSIEPAHVPLELLKGAREAWDQALEWGEACGYRNSQVSVLAPTGTIGFMMDCDTTGVEPDIALIKYKKLVGGGLLKIVNNTIPIALRRLGYDPNQISEIIAYIDENETIEGAPHLAGEQLPVFDCAFKPQNGKRSIHHMGHVWMMAAVQPFISGAISKTVNMPTDATPDDIIRVYQEGWKLGLKAIAIYRDGCKRTQPLNTGRSKSDTAAVSSSESAAPQAFQPNRRKMPDTRRSITHKFSVGGHEGYITVGTFPDGSPGEIFLVMSKEGSVVSGLMDSFATAISLALQYGVPLTKLVDHFSHTRFEPSGFTKNAEIPYAKSLVDYIFRWLASQFLHPDQQAQVGVVRDRLETGMSDRVESAPPPEREGQEKFSFKLQTDAPPCHVCGAIMVRGGTCYKCLNCGATSGCS
jgi:ribonucleoside-diphosphate reductase alpha chain